MNTDAGACPRQDVAPTRSAGLSSDPFSRVLSARLPGPSARGAMNVLQKQQVEGDHSGTLRVQMLNGSPCYLIYHIERGHMI